MSGMLQKCPLSGLNVQGIEKVNGITFWEVGKFKYGIENSIFEKTVYQDENITCLLYCLLKEYYILHNKIPVLATFTDDKDDYFFITSDKLLQNAPKLEDIPYRTLRLYVKMSEKFGGYFSQKIFVLGSLNDSYTEGEDCFFFSRDIDTIKSTISYLASYNYIDLERKQQVYETRVRPEGIAFIKGYTGESNKGFVAMKFGTSPEWKDKFEKIHPEGERDLDKFYNETIKKAIEKAGFDALRIDEVSHNKKIDDEILVQIRKSKFMVCDLTYANYGAYYEAGFAQGLGKEVFFICEKSYFESKPPHFDINHHITTLYEIGKEDKFIKELSARIENNVVKI